MTVNPSTTRRVRLVAVDLDGTLVKHDGTIADEDLAALAKTRSLGIEVVVATGRLPCASLPLARGAGIDRLAICGDGSVVLGPDIREMRSLHRSIVRRLGAVARAEGLKVFVFDHEAVHWEEQDADHLPYVVGWSAGAARRLEPRGRPSTLLLLATGSERAVLSALEAARRGAATAACDAFCIVENVWALRARAPRIDKGTALRRLALRSGYDLAETAAIGNGENDVPLFQVVARSFAMADAPECVRAAASHVLSRDSLRGGGVAEAIELLTAG